MGSGPDWRQRARAIDRNPPLVPVRLGGRTRWMALGRWRARAWVGAAAHSGELAPECAWLLAAGGHALV